MLHLSGSELLFWGGILIMISSVIAAFAGMIVFVLTGRMIRRQLEREYGKPER
ncbi:MAG: hypothetical protein ACI39W_06675 [Brotaphodocola sp.]